MNPGEASEQLSGDKALPPLDPEVREAVIPAYYEALMSSASDARDRAQRAYVIASAIAAGLVTAGAFVDIGARPLAVQIAGIAAVSCWMLAAWFFMYAVGAPTEHLGAKRWSNADAFVRAILTLTRDEREAVNRRQARARAATLIALILTLLAIGLGLLKVSPPSTHATLQLSDEGAAALERVCGRRLSLVQGTLALPSLDQDLIEISVPQTTCGAANMVRLPRRQVQAVVSER